MAELPTQDTSLGNSSDHSTASAKGYDQGDGGAFGTRNKVEAGGTVHAWDGQKSGIRQEKGQSRSTSW
jgi:hypothetical protein